MSNYTKSTNFASKDSLAVGNPLKIVKGTEIDAEFNNIATAVATKADLADPTFTGVPAAPTATPGTSTTQLATTAFVAAAVNAYDTALTVSTAQIEDDAVTAAKIAAGAVGNSELATDAVTQAKIADNAVGTAEIIDATVTPAKLSQPLTRITAVATTSGTSVDFIGIPNWVKRITVGFNNISTNGSSLPQVQLGNSGGIQTTNYTGSASALANGSGSTVNLSTGFLLSNGTNWSAAYTFSGKLELVLLDNSTGLWACSGVVGYTGATLCVFLGGVKTLSGTLDRIRLTTINGTDIFDAGSVNILYE